MSDHSVFFSDLSPHPDDAPGGAKSEQKAAPATAPADSRPDPFPVRSHLGPSLPLFDAPVGGETLSRRDGPATSAEAAASLRGTQGLAAAQRLAHSLVRLHPGSTAAELSRLAGHGDPRIIGRRLSELARAGLVFAAGSVVDPITNRRCARWYAAPSHGGSE
jgi:hypothetical protein